jgi:LacI family transcriptional regulator
LPGTTTDGSHLTVTAGRDAPVRIALAAVAVGPTFPGLMFAKIHRLLKPGQEIVECITVGPSGSELARSRLLELLDGTPKPIALIGAAVRPDPVVVSAFRAIGAPIVLLDEEAPGASTVACDNVLGGQLAGAHLTERGRRRFAVVIGHHNEDGDMSAHERLVGFQRALAEKGFSVAPSHVLRVPHYSHKDGTDAMAKLLDSQANFDAIFCAAGDVSASGMLATARRRGVKIPDDVAVVGFDDNALASISDPPLTTIRQPYDELAETAFRLATEETAKVYEKPGKVLLAPRLVVRGST